MLAKLYDLFWPIKKESQNFDIERGHLSGLY